MTQSDEVGWRTGRKLGRTLYEDGELVGRMKTRELASRVARVMNDVRAAAPPKSRFTALGLTEKQCALRELLEERDSSGYRERASKAEAGGRMTQSDKELLEERDGWRRVAHYYLGDFSDAHGWEECWTEASRRSEVDGEEILAAEVALVMRDQALAQVAAMRAALEAVFVWDRRVIDGEIEADEGLPVPVLDKLQNALASDAGKDWVDKRRLLSEMQDEGFLSPDEARALVDRVVETLESPNGWHSLCIECGPNVGVDEDGCCASCGATATGSWLDQYRERVRALDRAALFGGRK